MVNEQQLTELSNQLTLAGANADEAKARLDQIDRLRRENVDAGAIAEAVQSQTVAALRAQYAEVMRRKAELTARLGARHPSIADINAQASDLQQLIDREVGRLSMSARGDYDRAVATRDALLRRLDTLKQDAVTTSQALVRLRELEREVEASRAVYQAYLTRSRETSEQERFNTANVRVLSDATLPEKRAFPPRGIVVLALALMFGGVAGAGIGFVQEWTDDRIHSRRRLEAICDLPILAELSVPEQAPRKGWWARLVSQARAYRNGASVRATLLEAPKSSFATGVHRLRYALRSAASNGAPQVMLFIAAGAPGARTEVALNLALAAASNQPHVMLVDADLNRHGLSDHVVGGTEAGLLDVADGRVQLETALIPKPNTSLMVLKAGRPAADSGGRQLDPATIVKVIAQARATYTVVVDGPTDHHNSLGPTLAEAADFAILVVTAGLTRTQDIKALQRSNEFPAAQLRGVVLVARDGAML